MRNKLFAFMMCLPVVALSLSYHPAKAQTTVSQSTSVKDSAALLATPVFNGSEKNLQDSVLAVAQAAVDPATKEALDHAVQVLKDTPKEGGIDKWIAYIIAAISALTALYLYLKNRWTGIDGDGTDPDDTPQRTVV